MKNIAVKELEMAGKLLYTIIIISALIFSGCAEKTGPIVINVGETPVRTQKYTATQATTPAPTATQTATPLPTEKKESLVYIEDIKYGGSEKTIKFGGWDFGSNQTPFTLNGQSYNKGIGIYIKSRNIKGERGSIDFVWDLDKDYYKIAFDLGCEQKLQYDGKEKYGTFQITVYADSTEVWDSGEKDYQYFAENIEIELPEGTKRLDIKLTQSKGINGTLNVVLGSFKLYYNE